MAISESEVLAYLHSHADFLHTHGPDLGWRPHEDKIRSFHQGSVAALKAKTERMAEQLAQMLEDAERNHATANKLLAFNQKLLAANTLAQLWQAAAHSLTMDFQLPIHGFALLAVPDNQAHVPVGIDATDNKILQRAWADLLQPLCGTRLPEAAYACLGEGGAQAESFLQLPVRHHGELLAVLLIGHQQADYFHPGLATDLVDSLAVSLAVAMARIMGRAVG